jgi:hypothetical protein
MLESWSATTVALSAFEAQPDVTETTDHEDNEDFTDHSEKKEVAKEEHRSGAFWENRSHCGNVHWCDDDSVV